jgi:hypothetical protein
MGVEARSRAQLSDGEAADRLYRETLGRLGRTRIRVELDRAHLLYGSGCAGSGAAPPRASNRRTAGQMLNEIGRKRSPGGPGASCGQPAGLPAGAP